MFTLLFLSEFFWGIVKYMRESLWFDQFTWLYLHFSQTWCMIEIMTVGDLGSLYLKILLHHLCPNTADFVGPFLDLEVNVPFIYA